MKNKFLTIGLPIMGGLLIAGVGIASAAGFMGGAGGFSTVSPTTSATNQAAQFQAEASETGFERERYRCGLGPGRKPFPDRDGERHHGSAVADWHEDL